MLIRENKILDENSPYGGGQVLEIDTEKMQVTFVAHRGFGPDGSTIYYIATDASKNDVAEMLGVVFAERVGATLVSGASSDLYVFTNGINGTGPMGFQASIGSTNVGDEFYSPIWRIQEATWKEPTTDEFLVTTEQITTAGSKGTLTTEVAGVVVNYPFVLVDEKFMMEDLMSKDMKENMIEDNGKMIHMESPLKQMRSGVDIHKIQCNPGHELVLKTSDWSPACVKSSSIERLLEIGWASDHEPSHDEMKKES